MWFNSRGCPSPRKHNRFPKVGCIFDGVSQLRCTAACGTVLTYMSRGFGTDATRDVSNNHLVSCQEMLLWRWSCFIGEGTCRQSVAEVISIPTLLCLTLDKNSCYHICVWPDYIVFIENTSMSLWDLSTYRQTFLFFWCYQRHLPLLGCLCVNALL